MTEREREPTVKEYILASLLSQGPATHEELILRLKLNPNSIHRELADMVRLDQVAIQGRRRRQVAGRDAYIYRHPETVLPEEPARQAIRPMAPPPEAPMLAVVFGETIPAYALQLDTQYQRLWRNGL